MNTDKIKKLISKYEDAVKALNELTALLALVDNRADNGKIPLKLENTQFLFPANALKNRLENDKADLETLISTLEAKFDISGQ